MTDRNNSDMKTEEQTKEKAVVLLSGGPDSATTLAEAIDDGYEPHCLIFKYGQTLTKEIEKAQELTEQYGIKSTTISLDLQSITDSAILMDSEKKIPERDDIGDDIPETYVPSRNIIFLSMAASFAEKIDATNIFIGVTHEDYSGYPDCRPEFINAFEKALNEGTKTGVEGKQFKIRTPVIYKSKKEILLRGIELGVPLEKTWSCYKQGDIACGKCDSCQLRLKGFNELDREDPLPYEEK